MTSKNICLTGLMGSGKSTLAPLLARQLGYALINLDKEIAVRMGRTIMMIFADQGEETFRREEEVVLQHACSKPGQVIDCGGGIVVSERNRALLSVQFTIFLSASPETLAARIGPPAGRPLLAGAESVPARLGDILAEREPLYRQCASLVISTEKGEPAAIAAEILAQLPEELQPVQP